MRGYACRKPLALLSDGGCDSYDNNRLALEYGVIPIIRARENAVGEVLHLLNALTGYKLRESGLTRVGSAFRRIYNAYNPENIQWTAKQDLQNICRENIIYA